MPPVGVGDGLWRATRHATRGECCGNISSKKGRMVDVYTDWDSMLFGSSGLSLAASTADEIFRVYERSYCAAWSAFPDAAPALSALQDYRLAVLTNGENSQQTQKLQAYR